MGPQAARAVPAGPGPGSGDVRGFGSGVARAAVLVGLVTVVSRAVGFGRWLVFSQTVGDTCLGDAYNTANQLPNVAFEIVAGGALTAVVVPVLAGAFASGDGPDRAAAGRTMLALFTWTVLALIPVTVLAAVAAGPYARLMLAADTAGCPPATRTLSAWMLCVFAPQILCYGVAVVAAGTLQARRRFGAAATAPLVSSLVVVASYAGFGILAGGRPDLAAVPFDAVLVLAGGTTLGVVALTLTVAIPLGRAGLPFRPTLRFPPGLARPVRRLAAAGLAAVVAQQLVTLVLTWLANHRGDEGTLTLFTWALAVFMLPYAVLAVPLATSVFPYAVSLGGPAVGSEGETAPGASRGEGFDRLASGTLRAVVLLGSLGGALLAGTSVPVAEVFVAGPDAGDAAALAAALVAFAVGVPAFGVLTLAARLLYARGRQAWAAGGTTAGWLAVAVTAVVVTGALTAGSVPAGLGAAMSTGLAVGAAVLLLGVRLSIGAAALRGLARAALAAAVAGVLAAAVGRPVGTVVADGGMLAAIAGAALSGVVVTAVYGTGCVLLDRRDARQAWRQVAARFGRPRPGGPNGADGANGNSA